MDTRPPTSAQVRALLRLKLPPAEIKILSRRDAWGLIKMGRELARADAQQRHERQKREDDPETDEIDTMLKMHEWALARTREKIDAKYRRRYGDLWDNRNVESGGEDAG